MAEPKKNLKKARPDTGIPPWAWALLLGLFIALPSYFIFNPPISDQDSPRVVLNQGTYTGTVLSNNDLPVAVEAWLGVPYAKPPVGKLRFARPQPLPAARRKHDATEFGYRCPGNQLLKPLDDLPDESEDCLTANIFKQKDSGTKLPVMVYVHGGAFNRGYSSMHNTASMLSWSPEPFIAVSFNYRLGALGFLPSSVSAKEGILNLGLRDQTLLLEWVQHNIEAFGGNPRDVTLAGLSAGAHSVGHHIMNINEERELFHKAIIESGGPTSRAVHPANSALHEAQFQRLLEETSCQDETEDRKIQCLREVQAATIVDAQAKVFDEYNPSLRWAWQPSIDGDLISRRPIEAWQSGKWHNIPILTGFNHNEGTHYVPKTEIASGSEFTAFFKQLLPQLSDADLIRIDDLYADPDTEESSAYVDTRNLEELGISAQFKRIEAAYGHYAYVCPVKQTAHLGSAAQSEPIYLYHWALNRTVLGGANHADQMPYETMSPHILNKFDVHDRIAQEFHSYLTSFIVSGDPNKIPGLVPDRPEWAPYDRKAVDGNTMVFGHDNDEAAGGEQEGSSSAFIQGDWARRECKFWWKVSQYPEV